MQFRNYPGLNDALLTVSGSAPRISFIGFCEKSQEINQGNIYLWHWNLLGLSTTRTSYVYPLDLRGLNVVLGIFEPMVSESLVIHFRPDGGSKPFDIKIQFHSVIIEQGGNTVDTVEDGRRFPGWTLLSSPITDSVFVFEPDEYKVYLVADDGKEAYLGSMLFAFSAAPPILQEEWTNLQNDPLARKGLMYELGCAKCHDALKVYTAFERSAQLESEGWLFNHSLAEVFKCSCGEHHFSLKSLRLGFHGLLRPSLASRLDSAAQVVHLYQQSGLEEQARRFIKLLKSDPREEMLQQFLEENPIFLSIFSPSKIMHKKPILAEYVCDFAILNPRKELLLVEIETGGKQLIKKDGGISAQLQHALDQVRNWLRVFSEERSAALRAFNLTTRDVAKLKGIVIAGRTPPSEMHVRDLRHSEWGGIELFTYDDLIRYVVALARQLATQ